MTAAPIVLHLTLPDRTPISENSSIQSAPHPPLGCAGRIFAPRFLDARFKVAHLALSSSDNEGQARLDLVFLPPTANFPPAPLTVIVRDSLPRGTERNWTVVDIRDQVRSRGGDPLPMPLPMTFWARAGGGPRCLFPLIGPVVHTLYVVDAVVPPRPVQFVWKNWPRALSTRS